MISGIIKSVGVGSTIQTAELDDDSVTSDKIANTLAVATSLTSTTAFVTTGTTVATKPSVTNLGDNGSIPITATFANIDAAGSARTGIRFGGAGTAGQILIVNNTGGENLQFHGTEGTALLRGIHSDHDFMSPSFMGLFISDGTYWNLIAGGVDTQPDVGLATS